MRGVNLRPHQNCRGAGHACVSHTKRSLTAAGVLQSWQEGGGTCTPQRCHLPRHSHGHRRKCHPLNFRRLENPMEPSLGKQPRNPFSTLCTLPQQSTTFGSAHERGYTSAPNTLMQEAPPTTHDLYGTTETWALDSRRTMRCQELTQIRHSTQDEESP